MRFTLIVTTLGRTDELVRLFDSLVAQTHQDFIVRLTDQNDDDRLAPIIARYQDRLTIERTTSGRGVSRGRNASMHEPLADIVAFPDDDCWYPEDALENLVKQFKKNPSVDGFTVKSVDDKAVPRSARATRQRTPLSKWSIFSGGQCVEYCTFLKADIIRKTGRFDENMGVGGETPWGADEGADLILRALARNFSLIHEPNLHIFHPTLSMNTDDAFVERTYSYSSGTGYLWRKHAYPAWFLAYYVIRAIIAATAAALSGKPRRIYVYRARISGYLNGYFNGRPDLAVHEGTHAGIPAKADVRE